MNRTIAATAALLLSVTSANATQVYLETDSVTLAAPGTISSGGTGTGGGLCTPGTAPCPAYGGTPALTGGLLTIAGTSSAIGNYLLTLTFNGVGSSSDGSIWDATVVNGGVGTSLGTTNIVKSTVLGSGTVSSIVSGNGTFTIGITDLLEQYQGLKDTLPGVLGNSSDNSSTGTVNEPYSLFTLTYSVTSAPEPASITLFGCAIAALGAVRRRHNQRSGRLA